jgi:hypothetical protein
MNLIATYALIDAGRKPFSSINSPAPLVGLEAL